MKRWVIMLLILSFSMGLNAQFLDLDLDLSADTIEITEDNFTVDGVITNNGPLTFLNILQIAYNLEIVEIPFPLVSITVIDTIDLLTPFLPGNSLNYSKNLSPVLPEYNYELNAQNIITIWPIINLLPLDSTTFYRDSVYVVEDGILDSTLTATFNPWNQDDIKVYPNPSSGFLLIDLLATDPTKKVLKISDADGRLVHNTILSGSTTNLIDISRFRFGIYFIVVYDEHGSLIYKGHVVKTSQ